MNGEGLKYGLFQGFFSLKSDVPSPEKGGVTYVSPCVNETHGMGLDWRDKPVSM